MLEWRIRKQIEHAFYNYEALKRQGAEYLVDLAQAGITAKYDSVGGRTGCSNPTQDKAILCADAKAVGWCHVVERTRERYTQTDKEELIKQKYIEHKSPYRICNSLYITKTTLYEWINEILTFAAMVAIQEGLIKI
jgi:hypothetical protein